VGAIEEVQMDGLGVLVAQQVRLRQVIDVQGKWDGVLNSLWQRQPQWIS